MWFPHKSTVSLAWMWWKGCANTFKAIHEFAADPLQLSRDHTARSGYAAAQPVSRPIISLERHRLIGDTSGQLDAMTPKGLEGWTSSRRSVFNERETWMWWFVISYRGVFRWLPSWPVLFLINKAAAGLIFSVLLYCASPTKTQLVIRLLFPFKMGQGRKKLLRIIMISSWIFLLGMLHL